MIKVLFAVALFSLCYLIAVVWIKLSDSLERIDDSMRGNPYDRYHSDDADG